MDPLDRVEKATHVLRADFERQGGKLTQEQIDRVIDRRGLSPEESLAVYENLSQMGIAIEIEEVVPRLSIDLPSSEEADRGISSDTLVPLFHDLRRETLLTAKEEVELGRSIALAEKARLALEGGGVKAEERLLSAIARGSEARQRMILANIKLVVSLAKKYARQSELGLSDLVQEGVLGLMRAVEKFDYQAGFKFSTYATWWIRQAIVRALADKGRLVRFPVHMVEAIQRLRAARRLFERTHGGQAPSLKELATELNWSLDRTHFIQEMSRVVRVSLEAPIQGAEDVLLGEVLSSTIQDPQETAEIVECAAMIREVLGGLSDKERTVLTLRFGLEDSGREHTLEEIGEQFGLTRERIRQIEKKAIGRVRKRAGRVGLSDFAG